LGRVIRNSRQLLAEHFNIGATLATTCDVSHDPVPRVSMGRNIRSQTEQKPISWPRWYILENQCGFDRLTNRQPAIES
jgi:hypothetical protein